MVLLTLRPETTERRWFEGSSFVLHDNQGVRFSYGEVIPGWALSDLPRAHRAVGDPVSARLPRQTIGSSPMNVGCLK